MKSILAMSLLAIVAATGCRSPWSPENGPIIGTVVYPDGTVARSAKVQVVNGGTTYTSYDGRFQLSASPGADSVTVIARDGYDGRVYAVTHFGAVRIKPAERPSVVRIVLSGSAPI